MKIYIEKDELYPCYYLTDDENEGETIEVSEEMAYHYRIILKEFEKIQMELDELYEAALDARIKKQYDWRV